MTTFEAIGISPELVRGIRELGFENPMPIQDKIIPVLLKSKQDIIGFAQTGTGKTAAFGLPLIQLINLNNEKTQALILAPTRELCLQIANDLKNYAKYLTNLNIVTIYGGADIVRQMKAIKAGAHIIVATPGRMNDLLNRRKKIDVSAVQTVVLDEADEMLSMGFKEDLDAILAQTPASKTTLMFSATMPAEIQALSKNYQHEPLEISVGQRNVGAENVSHICYSVHEKNRYQALKRIVDFNPNIYGIIFCRTREETKKVAEKLIQDGYNADALHGDLTQAQREAVMHKFRIRHLHLLTATDVAARGLDVKDITHIINYNLPDESIIYIHRSGRTGRAGQTGISIAITNLKEQHQISQIEYLLKKKFEMQPVPSGRAICEKRLFDFVERLEKIDVEHDDIDQFLPAVNEKLAWLDREALIKRVVALEFNQFLNYYKTAADINAPIEIESVKPKRVQKHKKAGNQHSRPGAEEGFTRFHINLGQKDRLTPMVLLGLVNKTTRKRNIEVGKIEIQKDFSFFEVDEYFSSAVLSGFFNLNFNRKKVVVEIIGEDIYQPAPAPGKKKFSKKRFAYSS
ncbi:DEAD/DEAH box helicase [candidate division KSB1 bacterium]|nr:DEAD/DEAH box helicase [candidate division KSB1 bacterium]